MPAEMPPETAEAEGRLGCLVLTVGTAADMTWIAEAVEHAMGAVLDDPVLMGRAQVVALTDADTDCDLTVLAELVAGELRRRVPGPENPSNRVVLGVLVVHPDRATAQELVSGLSLAEALAALSVVALAGAPEPTPHGPARDPHTEVVHMVLDAVAALARYPERALSPVVADLDAGAEPLDADTRAAEPADRPRWWRPAPSRGPVADIELIDELSGIADRVSVLYLVLVSEPARRAKRGRRRRGLEVAAELTRLMLARADATPPDHWYVRAFSAGRRLRPGRPLPAVGPIRVLDLPERRVEPLDVPRCVDELRDAVRIDRAAFVRRGLSRPRAVAVFVADGPVPTVVDWPAHLARLGADARVTWLDLRPVATAGPATAGMTVLFDHEDVVDALVELVVSPSPDRPRRQTGHGPCGGRS